MASIADLFVNVGADISDFKKQMSDMQKTLKGAGDQMKSIGGTMSKAITAPVMAVGAAAFASANEFDKGMKTIRAGTGATGDDLKALGDNFRNVFADFPADAGTVSSALADINTRTGLTGKPLENMTKKFLELSKVTGQDVSSSIADVTRLFGDWGIEAENGGDAMDYLWKVSQTTGIGVDQLSQKLVQFGAPLRQVGFSMEESAAMMGKWEKEGVNMELVMGGLRVALGKMAQAGKEPQKEFPKIIEQIQNAGSAGEANAIALEHFGARAGADMAAAIREGRFSIDELMGTLGASEETIGKAAADTMTLGEQFILLKNNTMLALEPIGKVLLDLAMKYMPPLIDAVKRLTDWFAGLSPQVQIGIMVIAGIAAAIGPLLVVAGILVNAIAALIPLFTGVAAAISAATIPIWPIIAAVAALIAIGVLLYKNWDEVKAFAIQAWGAILAFIQPAVDAIRAFIMDKFEEVKAWWLTLWPTLQQAFTNIWNVIKTVITAITKAIVAVFEWAWPFIEFLIKAVWNNIKGIINGALNIIMGVISAFANLFTGNWQGLWDSVKQIISGALELIWNWVQLFGIGKLLKFFTSLGGKLFKVIADAWNKIKYEFNFKMLEIAENVSTRFNAIKAFFTTIWNAIKAVFTTVLNAIKTVVTTVFNAVKTFITTIWNGIKTSISTVINAIKSVITTVFNAIKTTIQTVLNAISSVISTVWNAIKSVFTSGANASKNTVTTVFNAIKSFIATIVNGIKSTFTNMWNSVKSTFTNGANAAKNAVMNGLNAALNFVKGLGTSFLNAGKGLIDMMAKGISNAASKVLNSVKDLAGKVRDFLPFSPSKEGPLKDLDKLDFGGPIEDSIDKALPSVSKMMGELMQLPGMEVNQSKFMTTAGNTVVVELDGRTIARGTLPHMEREIRLKTGLRF